MICGGFSIWQEFWAAWVYGVLGLWGFCCEQSESFFINVYEFMSFRFPQALLDFPRSKMSPVSTPPRIQRPLNTSRLAFNNPSISKLYNKFPIPPHSPPPHPPSLNTRGISPDPHPPSRGQNPRVTQLNTPFPQALIHRQEGRIQESLNLFQAVTCLNPHNVLNLKQVGRSLYLLGNHKAAVDLYDEVLTLSPDDWEVWHNKGLCFMY